MKKLLLIVIVAMAVSLSTTSTSTAQGISVEFGFTGNLPQGDFGDFYDFGAGLYLHPRFKINDKMAVGLNIGGNGFVGGDYENPDNPDASVSAAAVVNVLGSLQYKLLDKKVTPYGEIGVGMFKVRSVDVSAEDVVDGDGELETKDFSYFGFAPKVGVMVGFLNLHASYVIAGDLNYMQFGLGFRFGKK
jgi:hypothetical protein